MSTGLEDEDVETLGQRFLWLAEKLGMDVASAMSLYMRLKHETHSRITLDQIIQVLSTLPAGQHDLESLTAAVLHYQEIGQLPDATQAVEERIHWEETRAPRRRRIHLPHLRLPQPPRRTESRQIQEKPAQSYEPPPAKEDTRIEWGQPESPSDLPDPASLLGVEDAYEHTPLLAGEQVAFCKFDKVAYHLDTWKFLQRENHARCCSCGRSGTIVLLTLPGSTAVEVALATRHPIPAWQSANQVVIRLEDVHEYIGQAVVVEGFVHEAYQSKAGGTYFIRFEPREYGQPPFQGFKVVIFKNYQKAWEQLSLSPKEYQGHQLRVRGLIQKHETWGIEILVNSPRVIQVMEPSKETE